MNRALTLLIAGSALGLSATASAASPSIIGSIYAPDIDVATVGNASPDGLLLEIRQPLNRNFWLGAALATTLSDDQIAAGIKTELGASLAFNLGAQAEVAHHTFVYAYLGYGAAKVVASGIGATDIDGKGVGWGAGMQFLLNDHLLVDAGYSSLFDGDMENSAGTTFDTTIAGPRVGLGFRF